EGYIVRSDYLVSRESLGADSKFDQFNIDTLYAHRFDRHAVQLGGRYHVTISGVAPLESAYRLGGYTRLAGYQPNELVGQNYAMVLLGYSYEIAKVLRMPALLGGSIEYGNVWQQRSDMAFDEGDLNGSVYLGLDSWVGPILFGIGAREGGFHNVFLEVGHKF
ncbi:MAG TPA: patatin, partial [Xanthomonadales bacterium]|nr:patatin [Xanthomonadales bacterium]